MLWVLVRHRRPAVVVETGVARGVTSAFILDAMRRNDYGHLWSIDLPPLTAEWGKQTGMAVAPTVRDRWTYVRGAARRKLPKVLSASGPVDIFVHDGLHTTENVLFEIRTVWPCLTSSGIVVADDADHNCAVAVFSAEAGLSPALIREPSKQNVIGVITRA
jgi:predicted O-methyltransferase YrrM